MFQFAGFPPMRLCVRRMVAGSSPAGSPHSGTRGSLDICSSPRLFAACRAFRRLLAPRHPPCALLRLTSCAPVPRLAWRFLGRPGPCVRLFRVPGPLPAAPARSGSRRSPAVVPYGTFLISRCRILLHVVIGCLVLFYQYSVFKVQSLRQDNPSRHNAGCPCALAASICRPSNSFCVLPAATCSPMPSPA